MTTHGRHANGEKKLNENNPDKWLYRAWCGRWVPSWALLPTAEARCQSCRDRYARESYLGQR